jgi:hypothetical protein
LVWWELQSVSVKLQLVEPMPVAVRTEAPTRLRQEKRREKIVSLKTSACGYQLRARRKAVLFYPPPQGGEGSPLADGERGHTAGVLVKDQCAVKSNPVSDPPTPCRPIRTTRRRLLETFVRAVAAVDPVIAGQGCDRRF